MNVRRNFALLILALSFATCVHAQRTSTLNLIRQSATAELIEEFGIRLSAEDRSVRFDHFFSELDKNDSSGYVLIYCGQNCAYGEIEAHMRGIEVKTAARKFNRKRLVIMHGGFKENHSVELWLVPSGAAPPTSRATVHLRNVTFARRTRTGVEPYDCCDNPVYLWKTLKP